MYIIKSLAEGLRILGLDKPTIKQVSREKDLEEIFLSTLFINYLIVLIVYLFGIMIGGYTFNGRELNMPIFFGLLMVYPFVFNLKIYLIYGFFAMIAELIDDKKHIKPLLSVGFHTGIVYSFLVLLICTLSAILGHQLATILLSIFGIYFIYVMFTSISTVYNFSFNQTITVLLIPFLVIGIILTIIGAINPNILGDIITILFA